MNKTRVNWLRLVQGIIAAIAAALGGGAVGVGIGIVSKIVL